jgi:hypothetical protein
MPRGYKAIKQSFRERNKRQKLELKTSRIYTITLENTSTFYMKKDIKWPTTKMIGNSNKRILCDTSASDLGDKLVSDNHNHRNSRGRPIRLLCDKNYIKMISFRWCVTHRDKVHFSAILEY